MPGEKYTDEQKTEIIAHVLVQAATGRFISRVFREDETTANGVKMPAVSTFWQWVLEDDNAAADEKQDLSDKLVRARARGVEALLDQCGEIADDGTNDWYEKRNADGEVIGEAFDKEHVQRSKLRIETRIKMAQMLQPRKYGPKLDVTSDGKELSAYDALVAARQRALDKLDRKTD